jgi:tetratricopeptide (TPR) repeat protein
LQEAENIMRSVVDVMIKRRDEESSAAVSELVHVLLSQDKRQEAEFYVMMVAELGGPTGPDAFMWANILQSLDMNKQAAVVEEEAGRDQSCGWLARDRKVDELLHKGQEEEALQLMEEILKEAGGVQQAWVLAEEAARKAMEIHLAALEGVESHGSMVARYWLASALTKLGRFAEAAQMWRKSADWAEGNQSNDVASDRMVRLAEVMLLDAGVWEESVKRSIIEFSTEGGGATSALGASGGSAGDGVTSAAQLLEVRDVLVRASELQSRPSDECHLNLRLVACMYTVAAALGKAGEQHLGAAADLSSVALGCARKTAAVMGNQVVCRKLQDLHADLQYGLENLGPAGPEEAKEWEQLL